MTNRREFTRAVKLAIIKRATRAGVVHCEECQQPASRFDIHHVRPDGLTIDKRAKLTAADGQLLCAGSRQTCHWRRTAEIDGPAIKRAVRVEAKHLGASRPEGKLNGRGFPPPPDKKATRPARAPVPGRTGMQRRYV